MASKPHETLAQVRELLRAGKVQEADDCVTKAMNAAVASGTAPAPAHEPPAPPRKPEQVLVDLFDVISAHLGHPPSLSGLLDEIKTLWQEL